MIEDQVTYPLTTAMLTVPKSKVVRGFSFFGVSFVYIIFEDGTDIYWARSRVLEYLNAAARKLPAGVTPTLGPGCDRRRLGLSICAAVEGEIAGRPAIPAGLDHPLRHLQGRRRRRSRQRRRLRQAIQHRRRSEPAARLDIPLAKVRDAIRGSNMDVGGRTVELSEFEFIVRGRGYVKSLADLATSF